MHSKQGVSRLLKEKNADVGLHYNSVWMRAQPILSSALCVHSQ
jgi:hypothetical protein